MSLSYGFALGGVLQTLCAMLVLPSFNWRYLVALTSLLSLLPLFLSPCLPESPRFYVAAGDADNARASLASIAHMNGVSVPSAARAPRAAEVVLEVDDAAASALDLQRAMQGALGRFSDVWRRGMSRFPWPLVAVWVGVSVAYLWQMFLASSLLASQRLSATCVSQAAAVDVSDIPAAGAWIPAAECDGISRHVVTEVFM